MGRFASPVENPQDRKGRTIPGARLYFYENESTTPRATYANVELTNPNPHPIEADGAGRFGDIWLEAGPYTVELRDDDDVLIWSRDDVNSISEAYITSAPVVISNVSDIFGLEPDFDGQVFDLSEYIAGSEVGFSRLIWRESKNKSLHNGITFFDPSVPFTNLNVYLNSSGGVGTGVFELQYNAGELTPYNAGAQKFGDAATSLLALAALGEPIHLPQWFDTTLKITVTNNISGIGEDDCGIRNITLNTDSSEWILVVNGNGILLNNFGVDGQCTSTSGIPNADPIWGPSTYDVWFGKRALYLFQCNNVMVSKVKAVNSGKGAAIRIDQCFDIKLDGCTTVRSRGAFGDGVYSFASQRVQHSNCTSSDYTRIGLVSEGNAGSPRNADKIQYSNCIAYNGHDQSINYGGGEFNSGFWSENSDDVEHVNCFAFDNESRGFNATPTFHESRDRSKIQYTNCHAISSPIGFVAATVNGIAGSKGDIQYTSCNSYDNNVCYSYDNAGGDLSVTYNNPVAYVVPDGNGNSAAFLIDSHATAVKSRAVINNAETDWADTSEFADNAKNTADVTSFNNAVRTIEINGLNNKTGLACIKNRQSVGGRYMIRNIDQNMRCYMSAKAAYVEMTKVSPYGVLSCDYTDIDITIPSTLQLQVNDAEVYGKAKLHDSLLYIFQGAGVLENERIVGEIKVDMQRDVTTSDFGLRIQCEQSVNKPKFVINGTFYNTNAVAAGASNNFIWVVRSGTTVLTSGAFKDSNVPNMYRVNASPANFAVGQQDVIMH